MPADLNRWLPLFDAWARAEPEVFRAVLTFVTEDDTSVPFGAFISWVIRTGHWNASGAT